MYRRSTSNELIRALGSVSGTIPFSAIDLPASKEHQVGIVSRLHVLQECLIKRFFNCQSQVGLGPVVIRWCFWDSFPAGDVLERWPPDWFMDICYMLLRIFFFYFLSSFNLSVCFDYNTFFKFYFRFQSPGPTAGELYNRVIMQCSSPPSRWTRF